MKALFKYKTESKEECHCGKHIRCIRKGTVEKECIHIYGNATLMLSVNNKHTL